MPAKASEKPRPKAKDDPFNLHRRTEQVYDWLLSDWEDNPDMKNRSDAIKILQYGANFLVRNLKLQDANDVSNAGSAVARYSGAFRVKKTPDGAGQRAPSTGPAKPALVTFDSGDDDSDDPEAA